MTKTTIDFADTLNPAQYEAVTHDEGPQLVLAGAGSGKTRVITYRIAWLVEHRGVAPEEITAVTFTNKAAGEMRERIEDLLRIHPLRAFVGTFHRYALRLLRAYGSRLGLPRDFTILDSQDQKTLIKKAIKEENLSEKAFTPQAMLSAISSAKNRLIDANVYERQAEDFFARRVARVYHRYESLVQSAGGIDFDDMLRLSVLLLRQDSALKKRLRRRTRYLLVDEFQDTNHAQLSLIHELAGADGNLTAVGDEDQGIYRWRGAEIENILHFENSFPGATIRKLERNYRSTQNILDASGALIKHNVNRRGKSLWTESGAGEPLLLYRARDELDEARWIGHTLKRLEGQHRLSDMAVLVRTHSQTRALEDELLRQHLPYALIGGLRFYERAEVKDLIAYLRLLRNPHDFLSFSRVINRPPRGIGNNTQELLFERANQLGRSPWSILIDDQLDHIPNRGAQALRQFRSLLQGLIEQADVLPLAELLKRVIEETAYLSLYDKGDQESQTRLDNIREFISAAQEYAEAQGYQSEIEDWLTAFLDHVSLVSAEDLTDPSRRISLMTLHSAKGLEFPVVVVAGLEEGVLPHFNARATADIEEERRLLYVGMTRARERLLLTTCQRRRMAGVYKDQETSPFLSEIPRDLMESEQSAQLFTAPSSPHASDVYSFFNRERPQQASSSSPPQAARNFDRNFDRTVEPVPESRPSGVLRINKGSRVRHAKLGRGKVLSIEGSGEDMRLSIYFEGVGRRKLVAKFAQLEIL